MTGASLPFGADVVLMKEYTVVDGDIIKVFKGAKPGDNIRYLGEDVSQGQLVLKGGKVIGPAGIGMLATLGRPLVRVASRPVVAVLVTGDALVGVNEKLVAGKIRDVNSYTLLGQIKRCSAIPKRLDIARDNQDEIRLRIQEGMFADMLITTAAGSR